MDGVDDFCRHATEFQISLEQVNQRLSNEHSARLTLAEEWSRRFASINSSPITSTSVLESVDMNQRANFNHLWGHMCALNFQFDCEDSLRLAREYRFREELTSQRKDFELLLDSERASRVLL